MTSNHFTLTELAILRVLSDGQPHTKDELQKCLPDELTSASVVRAHVSNIRKKIHPEQRIICEMRGNRRIHYRHVKIISSDP